MLPELLHVKELKEEKNKKERKKQTISVAVNRYLSWWFRLLARDK